MPFLTAGLRKPRFEFYSVLSFSFLFALSYLKISILFSCFLVFVLFDFAVLHDLRRRPFPIGVTIEIGSVSRCHEGRSDRQSSWNVMQIKQV